MSRSTTSGRTPYTQMRQTTLSNRENEVRSPDITIPRFPNRLARYRPSALADDQIVPTFLYHPGTSGDISYSKTALWLRTLENYLGWETYHHEKEEE